MNFECDKYPTLDGSYPIIVRSLGKEHEEYCFQFAVNKKEIRQLMVELNKALRQLLAEESRYKRYKKRMDKGGYFNKVHRRQNIVKVDFREATK